jgi:hypothetical protein
VSPLHSEDKWFRRRRVNFPTPHKSTKAYENMSLVFERIHHNESLTLRNLVFLAELQVSTMLIVWLLR